MTPPADALAAAISRVGIWSIAMCSLACTVSGFLTTLLPNLLQGGEFSLMLVPAFGVAFVMSLVLLIGGGVFARWLTSPMSLSRSVMALVLIARAWVSLLSLSVGVAQRIGDAWFSSMSTFGEGVPFPTSLADNVALYLGVVLGRGPARTEAVIDLAILALGLLALVTMRVRAGRSG